MKVSFSSLLRWGTKKGAESEAPRKGMARAGEAEPVPVGERRRCIRWPKNGSAKMSWIDAQGSWKAATVWLKNSGDGGVAVVSRRPVELESQVWIITGEGEDWQGFVRYSRETEDGFQIGFERIKAKPAKPEPGSTGTQVKWLDKSGKPAFSPISVRNAGEGRIEVVAVKAVPAPAIVLLSGKEVRCLASAKACHKRGNRFLVEMEVVSDSYKHPAGATA